MANSYRQLFDLTGKVAIVTGASKGIGEAIARGLAAFGAKVVVSSRKQDAVDAVAGSIQAAGGEAVAIAAHMGDRLGIKHLVARASEHFGPVGIIVNNAAANPVFGPLLAVDDDAFAKILEVNVWGPLALARQVHPMMRAQGGGSIINISSVGGLRPEPMLGLYSASKAALINLSQTMAKEWGADGIRVNVICPGLIQTKFSAALWQDEKTLERFLQTVPLGRIGQAEDVVGIAIYLASAASAYCTGAVFTADGGHIV